MREEKKPFRFLADEEFLALSVERKSAYLVRAQQELQERQAKLRHQAFVLVTQQDGGTKGDA